jgi:hypothetical protein
MSEKVNFKILLYNISKYPNGMIVLLDEPRHEPKWKKLKQRFIFFEVFSSRSNYDKGLAALSIRYLHIDLIIDHLNLCQKLIFFFVFDIHFNVNQINFFSFNYPPN